VITLAASAALADAAATAIGNRITDAADFDAGIQFAQGIRGLRGVVIIKGGKLAAWGKVKLCETGN
ncbi:MAG: UPF0280 family protein, partial [Chloroflexota bacterium]